jgi:hypothetical protein
VLDLAKHSGSSIYADDVWWKPDWVGISERDDRWTLTFPDGTVTQLRFDFAFTLVIDQGLDIRIESPFIFREPNASQTLLAPEHNGTLGSLLRLHQAKVVRADALRVGQLEIDFEDGSAIVVEPDGNFENFNVRTPDGEMLIGLPSGGIARFPAKSARP